ncbi:PHB depolymerase family esterase [Variovorax guangxiensis]|uniref:extracellular catalytic domain type 1 short-chain-length polyhydroxyalkanoate depolymerase n=1 Tax=Variovorax guangxiensis TaxID=1775474 RepID=UPI00285D1BD2|nr:PHB depolymerase family esterase [Variovorax guangxiensis]MDR6859599.1 poly(hydroxyalkanoate) depolymerase family esterase [Variovorax guangxiensis]
MAKRKQPAAWAGILARSVAAITQHTLRANTRAVKIALKPSVEKRRPPAGPGQWISGVAMGAGGLRRFRLYRPPDVKFGERLPLMVMLHGCGQDAKSFATSTRMNRIAARERFLVLYPEQDRMSNAQGCWNWFDTSSGRAYGEAALIMKAIDQVCLMYPVDRTRVAVAGLSAGASMAALLVTRHPDRFKAVVMHSGIPPGTAHSPLSALGAMHGHRATKPLLTTPATMAASWPPLMVIHGTLDRVVAASNGHAAVQAWADAAGARASRERSVQRGSRYPANVTDFKRKGHTVATLVEVARLGHAWSGGAARQPYSDGQGPDASRMTWAFAAKHFRDKANMP